MIWWLTSAENPVLQDIIFYTSPRYKHHNSSKNESYTSDVLKMENSFFSTAEIVEMAILIFEDFRSKGQIDLLSCRESNTSKRNQSDVRPWCSGLGGFSEG